MPSFVLIASNKATASSPPTVRDAPTFSHLVSGVKRLRNASRISGTVAHSRKKVSTSSIAPFFLYLPSYASPPPPYGMELRVMCDKLYGCVPLHISPIANSSTNVPPRYQMQPKIPAIFHYCQK